MEKTLNELAKEYKTLVTTDICPNADKFPHYDNNAIIDENKSVKWNMEEIKRRNTLYDEEYLRLTDIYDKTKLELILNITEAIRRELGETFSDREANTIFWHSYNIDNSDCDELFKRIRDYMVLVLEMKS